MSLVTGIPTVPAGLPRSHRVEIKGAGQALETGKSSMHYPFWQMPPTLQPPHPGLWGTLLKSIAEIFQITVY